MSKDVSVGSTTLALGLSIAALALWPGLITWILMALALMVWGVVMYFFRDPAREIPEDPVLILSPADGKVVEIITMPPGRSKETAPAIRVRKSLSTEKSFRRFRP